MSVFVAGKARAIQSVREKKKRKEIYIKKNTNLSACRTL